MSLERVAREHERRGPNCPGCGVPLRIILGFHESQEGCNLWGPVIEALWDYMRWARCLECIVPPRLKAWAGELPKPLGRPPEGAS